MLLLLPLCCCSRCATFFSNRNLRQEYLWRSNWCRIVYLQTMTNCMGGGLGCAERGFAQENGFSGGCVHIWIQCFNMGCARTDVCVCKARFCIARFVQWLSRLSIIANIVSCKKWVILGRRVWNNVDFCKGVSYVDLFKESSKRRQIPQKSKRCSISFCKVDTIGFTLACFSEL